MNKVNRVYAPVYETEDELGNTGLVLLTKNVYLCEEAAESMLGKNTGFINEFPTYKGEIGKGLFVGHDILFINKKSAVLQRKEIKRR